MSCQNRKIIFLFVALSVMTVNVSAGDLSVPDLISAGFDQILYSQSDHLYAIFGLNSSTANTIILNTMITPNDFLSNPLIQQEKN